MNKKWQINKPDEAKVEKLCKRFPLYKFIGDM